MPASPPSFASFSTFPSINRTKHAREISPGSHGPVATCADRDADTIAPPILRACLEISTQVVSACIPSLVPLILSIVGKERSSQRLQPYTRYNDDRAALKSRSSNKFINMLSLSEPEPLPEGHELSELAYGDPPDSDSLRLVDTAKPTRSSVVVENPTDQAWSGIMVTHQID